LSRKTLKTITCAIIALIVLSLCSFAQAETVLTDEDITCTAAMVLDEDTGQIFYAKNATEQIRPASTTKILTSIIVLERLDLNTEVTVTAAGANVAAGSSVMGVVEGEVLTVEQLLYGLMLKSGNDAAVVLALEVGGSIEGFAQLMNEKAAEIGMVNSHFVNPHGLDNDEHYTTVEDMALLTRYALTNYPELKTICGAKSYSIPATNKSEARLLTTTNKLLYVPEGADSSTLYSGATGLKTGTTPKAGGCLVATATKGNQNLIALVYGDMSKSEDGNTTGVNRYALARKLFNYGFDNFENIDMGAALAGVDMSVQVAGAAKLDAEGGLLKCTAAIGEEAVVTVAQSIIDSGISEITAEVTPTPGLTAPVKTGDVVGTAVYMMGDTVIYRGDVVATRDVLSQAEYDRQVEAGLITPIDPDDHEGLTSIEAAKNTGLLWLWLLIPAALIVFLIVRAFLVTGTRRHHRYQKAKPAAPTRPYHRPHRRRRRRF